MRGRDAQPYTARLAVRFALILTLALIPIGFIGIVQTNTLEREVQTRSEAALMGATLKAASAETGLIRRVGGMVAVLAMTAPNVLRDPRACNALMKSVAEQEPAASLVAVVPPSGVMSCSSRGHSIDLSGEPLVHKIIAARAPIFIVNPKGPVSGTSVLGVTHPIFDTQGTYLGYAVVSLPHSRIAELRSSAFDNRVNADVPIAFWTFDAEGTLLTSNVDLDVARGRLPVNRPLPDFIGNESSVFQAADASGRVMTYAIVPIVERNLYLMSSFLPEPSSVLNESGVSAYVPTVLMWLAGLCVAALAAERLVTRHVRTLTRAFVTFARGDRRLEPIDLQSAPAELTELAGAYGAMTESIVRQEADLEDSLHQKEVLLREVHHRVKNNLQLISSIMNIQIRSAKSGEAKALLKALQERMMSLATVHRELYQTSGLADVRARELLPDIVRQIMAISAGPEKPFDVDIDIDDLRLIPDQAVPLSLLLAEALTNAMKFSGATRAAPGRLMVALKRVGGSDAVLTVQNSHTDTMTRDLPPDMQGTGIGSQLITAFAQQLRGKYEFLASEGAYLLKVTFTVAPLSFAENRQAAVQNDWNDAPD